MFLHPQGFFPYLLGSDKRKPSSKQDDLDLSGKTEAELKEIIADLKDKIRKRKPNYNSKTHLNIEA